MNKFGKFGGMEIRYTKEDGFKFDIQVPIYPFVARAIGSNPKAYSVVDKWYSVNKYKYYRAALEDQFYRHEIITSECLLQVEYARKVLGIMAFFKQEENENKETLTYQSIIKIIIKAYPRAYQYMLKNNELSLEAYVRKLSKIINGIKNKDVSGLGNDLIVAIYLAELQGKVIEKSPVYIEFIQNLIQQIERASNIRKNTLSIRDIPPTLIDTLKKLEEKIQKNNLLNEFGSNLNYPHYKNDYWSSKYKGLWDYEKLSSVSIYENTRMDEEIYRKLSLAYIVNEPPDQEINLEDYQKYMISASIILRLIQAYNEAKEHYFRNHKEVMYVEMESLEMEKRRLHLESRNLEYKFECAAKQAENIEKQFKNYEITKEKQIKRLEDELAELRKNQTELIALREMVFAQKNESEEVREEKRDYSNLKEVQAVFVGGHGNWQKKMKEFLPESVFIGAECINFDLNLLKGTIFINTTYIGHAMYYRVIGNMTPDCCQLHYLNQVNIDRCLAEVENLIECEVE